MMVLVTAYLYCGVCVGVEDSAMRDLRMGFCEYELCVQNEIRGRVRITMMLLFQVSVLEWS